MLLKRNGMGCVFLRPHAAAGGSKRDFELSKVPGKNSGI